MLVIISDLHLTDGSLGETLPAGAFQLFTERLADLAVAASFRADGSYRPLESIDLILLGDVLDVVRSSRWREGPARPWNSPQDAALSERVTQITHDILRANAESLQALKRLSGEAPLRVPPANRLGQPVYQIEGQPVPVKTHYMVGNHDWFYRLPGPAYEGLRTTIARQMGLAGPLEGQFAHDSLESEMLLDVMRRHKVIARHGEIFDPFNFEGDRGTSSLGDAIVIELVNRFASEVQRQLAADLPVATVIGLREIDNVRPIMLVPVWVDGLLERTCPAPALRKQVMAIWDRLVDEFVSLDFVRTRDSWSPVDLVDGMARLLKFSKRMPTGWSGAIVSWMNQLRGRDEVSYRQHAMTERDFRNRRARHVVYGHTHDAEVVPLDASYSEGYVLNQWYFNAGTWRRVHRATAWAPAEHEFIAADSMSLLAFFQGGERKGRPFETWTGSLGLQPVEIPSFRVDPGQPQRTNATVAAASPVPAPHFSLSPTIVPAKSSQPSGPLSAALRNAPIVPARRS